MDTRTTPARLRIARLREAMSAANVQGVLVPSSDPHISEYLPGRWQGREWFSGFTGSMGTLVVTLTEAALFADSRYWTQAEAELAGSGITLVKIPTGAATYHLDWIAQQLKRGETLAVDGQGLAALQVAGDPFQVVGGGAGGDLHQGDAAAGQLGLGLGPVAAVGEQRGLGGGDHQRGHGAGEAGEVLAALPAAGQVFGQVRIAGRHQHGVDPALVHHLAQSGDAGAGGRGAGVHECLSRLSGAAGGCRPGCWRRGRPGRASRRRHAIKLRF